MVRASGGKDDTQQDGISSDLRSNPPEAPAMSIVQGELKGLAIQEHEITQLRFNPFTLGYAQTFREH